MSSPNHLKEPHILSNEAIRFIAEQSGDSVFSVRVCPRSHVDVGNEVATKALNKLMQRLGSQKNKGAVDVDAKKEYEFSKVTGFSVGKGKDYINVLTVSHVIEEAYYGGAHLTAGSADSSTMDVLLDINTAYYFEVICVHQERMLKNSHVEDVDTVDRWYASGQVVAIDTRVDLLALKCPIEQINISGDDNYSDQCPHHGSYLAIADLPPPNGENVLLQSWPYLLSDFQRWGKISVGERPYNAVDRENKYGYEMKLTEIPGMKSVSECSGGPLVVGGMADDRFTYVGLYFKTIKNSGYAVSLGDIRNFLTRFGLLEDAKDAHAASEHVRENNSGDYSGGGDEEQSTTE